MSEDVSRGRLHLWSGLIILGAYLAGAATAAGLFAWLRPHHDHMRMHDEHGGPWGPLHGLELTSEQEEKARAIIEAHRGEVEAAMKETFPRIRATRDKALDEIRGVLTPEQAKRFDARRAEMAQREADFPPPPPPLPFGPPGRHPGPHPHHEDGPHP